MRYFNQTGAHALATSQYYEKQFWAGQFLVERQTQIKMNHNLSFMRRQQLEIQLEPLLGSGTRGAIHNDSRATSL